MNDRIKQAIQSVRDGAAYPGAITIADEVERLDVEVERLNEKLKKYEIIAAAAEKHDANAKEEIARLNRLLDESEKRQAFYANESKSTHREIGRLSHRLEMIEGLE